MSRGFSLQEKEAAEVAHDYREDRPMTPTERYLELTRAHIAELSADERQRYGNIAAHHLEKCQQSDLFTPDECAAMLQGLRELGLVS